MPKGAGPMTLTVDGAAHMHATHEPCNRGCIINYKDTETGKIIRHRPLVDCPRCRGTGMVPKRRPA